MTDDTPKNNSTDVNAVGLPTGPLIDVRELADALAQLDPPTVIDIRWRLTTPPGGVTTRNEYETGHIPGAAFLDLDAQLCGPPGAGGRHPLPEPADLQVALRAAGVGDGRPVVVYDGGDLLAASRLWWTLRWIGHVDVRVLDGGYPAWLAAGLPVDEGTEHPEPGDLTVRPGALRVLDIPDVVGLADAGRLFDVRAAPRFRGETEPVDPVAGHIPGARNLPDSEFNGADGRLLPRVDLRAVLAAAGVGAEDEVGVSCGSGIFAARAVLAFTIAGVPAPALYVGSWSHWITDPSRPVERGERVTGKTAIVWDEALLAYDLGDHPLDPVRVELTMALARDLGVFARPGVEIVRPTPADDATLGLVHTAAYIAAVKAQSTGFGLHTPDNPVFPKMHEASALVAGATVAAAEAVWSGRVQRAVSISGGLHHAMPDHAAGFCVYNDPAIAIARLLELGAERIAYIDVDVHHGDGVQTVFYDDPRVLTVSLHETPLALFPGTGFATETGGPGAPGSAVNVALPPGTGDSGWLRAFHAVVPSVVRAFRPQLIFSQCGADAHRLDPLADLRLTVDAQRESYLAMSALADELCEGRWVATGGGGYAIVEAVPRAWTHLLAIATGQELDPTLPIPDGWQNLAHRRRPGRAVPSRMTDGAAPRYEPWQPTGEPDAIDRAIQATRKAVFPLHGLDPDDPRD